MKLFILCATMRTESSGGSIFPGDLPSFITHSTTSPNVRIHRNTNEHNLGVVGSYQKLYEDVLVDSTPDDLLCYVHDDVVCREGGWDARVIKEFDADISVGLLGFGGAVRHGHEDLYKKPYVLQRLARYGYLSNVDDAEVHGKRFTGSRDIAVLDGFCLIVHRGVLDRIGGWRVLVDVGIDFIAYDYVMCALVRRLGYRIKVVGVQCHHRGGGTSVGVNVEGKQAEYDYAHRWCYENLRDVLPYEVKGV